MDFKNFTSKVLKDIVKKYELHYIDEFKGYTTFGKAELLNKIKKHLYIEGDLIKQKKEPFSVKKPLTTQQKKDEKDEKKIKDFFAKQLEGKDLLIKPLEYNLNIDNPDIKKRKVRKDKGIKKGKVITKKGNRTLEEIGIQDMEEKGKKAEKKLANVETMEDLQKIFSELMKGKGKKEDILVEYKKVQNSSDKERALLNFIKKYPELGLTESKVIGLMDRKPWFQVDKIIFDIIMGMRGGGFSDVLKGVLDVAGQSGQAGEIVEKVPGLGKLADILKGIQAGVDLTRATGATLKNMSEQYAPGASQNPILKKNFGWLGFGSKQMVDDLIKLKSLDDYIKYAEKYPELEITKDMINEYKDRLYLLQKGILDLIMEIQKSGGGKKEDILADYKKVQNSSDKERALLNFIKKYPELGLTESKVIGLMDRKPWFQVDKIIFDIIMGMRGGAKEEKKSGYGLHAVIIKNSIPFDEAEKKAKDITKKKKIFVRKTKDSYRFRNIAKTKFEKKTFRSKKIDKDITLVFGKLKPEFVHLEGAGIFDWLKSGFEKVKSLFNRPEKFNNTSRKTLEKYGDKKINELTILRTPIVSMIKKALKLIGANIKYDDLFHLGLIADVEGGKKIILEKNEVINIDDKFKSNSKSEYLKVPYNGRLTLNELVNSAMPLWNPQYKFFEYNFKTNNCQIFIKNLLKGSNLLNAELEKFIMQDVNDLLGNKGEKVATLITDVAGVFNKLTGGRIVGDEVIESKDVFLNEKNTMLSVINDFTTKLEKIKTQIENNPDFKALQPFEISARPLSSRQFRIESLPGAPEIVRRASEGTMNPILRAEQSSASSSIRNVLSPESRRQRIQKSSQQTKPQTASEIVISRRPSELGAQEITTTPVTPKKGILGRVGEAFSVLSPRSKLKRQQAIKDLTKPPSGSGKRLVGGVGNVSLIKDIRSALVKHLKDVLKIYIDSPTYKANYPEGHRELKKSRYYVDDVFFGMFDDHLTSSLITEIESLGKRNILKKIRGVRDATDNLRQERKELITFRAITVFQNAIARIIRMRLWNPTGVIGEPNMTLGDQLTEIVRSKVRSSPYYARYVELDARSLLENQVQRQERDAEIQRLQEEMGELEDRMDTISEGDYITQANALRDRYRELTSGRTGSGKKRKTIKAKGKKKN